MIDKVEHSQCCLCGNCVQKCPVNAIEFSTESNGFKYPKIDVSKCIGCNMCEIVCPSLHTPKKQHCLESYAAKNKDRDIMQKSSSGGIFSAMAEYIFEKNGAVSGAIFDQITSVKHIVTDKSEDLELLRGSKYVQSSMGNSFKDIERRLKAGQTVLFTGCPCQTAALKTYIKSDCDRLYTVDFICHGMLSEKLFKEYIGYLEKKYKKEICDFKFRDKTEGWADSGPKVMFKDGSSKTWVLYEDLYMQGYFQNLCMKEACYDCKYKDYHSGSDITMGDFWGAEVLEPSFYDWRGVSLIVVQTPKGEELLDKIQDRIHIKKLPLEELTKYNQGMFKPFKKGPKSELFWETAKAIGEIRALEELTKVSFTERLKDIYRRIRRKLRNRRRVKVDGK